MNTVLGRYVSSLSETCKDTAEIARRVLLKALYSQVNSPYRRAGSSYVAKNVTERYGSLAIMPMETKNAAKLVYHDKNKGTKSRIHTSLYVKEIKKRLDAYFNHTKNKTTRSEFLIKNVMVEANVSRLEAIRALDVAFATLQNEGIIAVTIFTKPYQKKQRIVNSQNINKKGGTQVRKISSSQRNTKQQVYSNSTNQLPYKIIKIFFATNRNEQKHEKKNHLCYLARSEIIKSTMATAK